MESTNSNQGSYRDVWNDLHPYGYNRLYSLESQPLFYIYAAISEQEWEIEG
jgi:hypothetical protein